MKKAILGAIPEMFSIRGHDYSRFLVQGGAEQMMKETWERVGSTLGNSMAKIGRESHGRASTDGSSKKKAA